MRLRFEKSARAVLQNADRLIEETHHFEFEDQPTTSFYLLQLAQEEAAKAFLLALVYRGVIPWDDHLFRACQDHKCKQLVGLVLDYICPPDEEDDFLKNVEKLVARSSAEVPKTISDAIKILRYEKIGRWQSNRWVWAEAPDRTAMKVSEGALDAYKQDAIYVRLGRDGAVAHTPMQLKVPKYPMQQDSARRMIYVVESLLGKQIVSRYELERIEGIFRELFTVKSAVNGA